MIHWRGLLGTRWGSHDSAIVAMSFLRDGQYLATAALDGVKVWDLESRRERVALGPLDGIVTDIATGNGRVIVARRDFPIGGSDSGELTMWSFGANATERLGPDNLSAVVSADADGGLAVAGCKSGTVVVCETGTGRKLWGKRIHDGSVTAVSIMGKLLVSAGKDRRVFVSRVADGSHVRSLTEHDAAVRGIAVSSKQDWFATCGEDSRVNVWHKATLDLVAVLRSPGVVSALAFDAGHRLAGACKNGSVIVWDVGSGKVAWQRAAHRGACSAVAFSPDGVHLVSGGGVPRLEMWNAATGERVAGSSNGHSSAVRAIDVSRDGRTVATADSTTMRLWSGRDLKETASIGELPSELRGLALSPNARWIVSIDVEGCARQWDPATGTQARLLQEGERTGFAGATCVCVVPGGTNVAIGRQDGGIEVFDLRSGKRAAYVEGDGVQINALVATKNGRWLVAGDLDGRVRLQTMAELDVVWTIEAHGTPISGLAANEEIGMVASVSRSEVRLWKLKSGKQIRALAHAADVEDVSFAEEGPHLVTAGWDGVLRLWSARNGNQIDSIEMDSKPTCLVVRARSAWTGHMNSTACLYTLASSK